MMHRYPNWQHIISSLTVTRQMTWQDIVMHDKACGHIGLLGKINTKHVHACVSFFKQSEAICRWKSSIYTRHGKSLTESHIYLLSHFLPIVTTKYDFLGETSSQTIANSRLGFIFPNGSIIYNDSGVYFQSFTPVPIRVPNSCDLATLKSIIHITLNLTHEQFLNEIHYR